MIMQNIENYGYYAAIYVSSEWVDLQLPGGNVGRAFCSDGVYWACDSWYGVKSLKRKVKMEHNCEFVYVS